ncbi:hypothetical protein ATCVMO0605SPH_272R [Acanthocystis turfacea Chlorella virus MO0605SPH]|uniref:Uncharacterized protein Z217R n=1 Tax=Chlorovirus heliozoae TaxID=322019 RepID=A7K8H7_9PHYC|nr:hypothetical protein ATCV1_Z217R [Acanthocystis turfacea chlorella virus 1]ABT16351.1 hypothetical protein ATCV1_Z217R [Acanthocystis turfacea chlorella virus 1]AGE55924.1 hypothetical protein ATCVMO0605SPH_272R [Acanthocystis turfacea Chlorella virus MO0605SPH]AGE60042.1 hypothetical protein ATCVWI0606_278R [Acanthocystis turfacea Chlorella virus WI0606]
MSVQSYIDHVEKSFKLAKEGVSKCTPEVLEMDGMSGAFTRAFYNNLLDTEDARYLEIGAWKGSSTCSALCGNEATVTVIDNWSEFGGPRDECMANIVKVTDSNHVTIVDHDSFTLDLKYLPNKYNMYLYDGCHKRESHEKALTYYQDVLDDVFIFVCDDWNWGDVQDGTRDAIKKLGLIVEHEIIEFTDYNGCRDTFWNGIAIFVLRKP